MSPRHARLTRSAVQDLQRDLEKVAPDSNPAAGTHAALGLAYAGLGEAASAIAEGQKAMAMHPTSKDPFDGPAKRRIWRSIYALLGDADHAIPILKRLLQIPYGLVRLLRRWLRLDPSVGSNPQRSALSETRRLAHAEVTSGEQLPRPVRLRSRLCSTSAWRAGQDSISSDP